MRKLSVGIINGILAVAILFMGLPCFITGDLNHDQKVDLADAILGVRDLAYSADETVVFGEKIKNAVSAVQIAAGLEARIVPDDDAGIFKSLDNHFLVSPKHTPVFSVSFQGLPATESEYRSIIPSPPVRPPRMA